MPITTTVTAADNFWYVLERGPTENESRHIPIIAWRIDMEGPIAGPVNPIEAPIPITSTGEQPGATVFFFPQGEYNPLTQRVRYIAPRRKPA